MTRIMDKPAQERLLRARHALITGQSFFGALALSQRLVERESIVTAAVDGVSLFYAPSFIQGLSEPELIGLLAHEVCHLALMHHVRRGGRDAGEWNVACDIAVNSMCLDSGFVLPPGAIVDRSYDGMTAEEIFAHRAMGKSQQQGEEGEEESTPQEGEGSPQDGGEDSGGEDSGDAGDGAPAPSQGDGEGIEAEGGGGNGGQPAPDPGMCGAVLDAADNAADLAEAAAATESMVRQAIAVAASQAGELPAGLRRVVDELNRARIDWHDVYARFINDAASRVVDWTRRSKRFPGGGFFMPSTKPDSVACVAMAVDTSGSINDEILKAFASEAQGTLDSGRVERLYVVYCDAAVHDVAEFVAGDTLTLDTSGGGGGTSFKPAFEHIAEHCPEAAAIVYLTDLQGYGDCWGDEPAVPVLWTVWGDARRAPFGEVVAIDPFA